MSLGFKRLKDKSRISYKVFLNAYSDFSCICFAGKEIPLR